MIANLFWKPIDSAILIYFRICAGILMGQELINGLTLGKLRQYTEPSFNFSYQFFEWIKPWPYEGMILHYALTIFSAFAVAFNYHYRIFSKILFTGYVLLFLFDQTEYINHTYLYCLLSFWMMFLPLDQSRPTFPAWIRNLLLFHMALAYFFGGIAKLNSDWLMGTPMDIYLSERTHYPLGFIYQRPWAPYVYSYGGLLFDLFIVPLLLYRHTRVAAFIMAIIFHLSNVAMFGLATFPWFSILMTSLFLNPSWPRRIPVLRSFMPWGIEKISQERSRKLEAVLITYAFIHLMLPLRHHFYPGVSNWTEEGHMFSWRMMLRDKKGTLNFYIQRPSGELELAKPLDHITSRQYDDIIGKPDLILSFAHYLRDYYKKKYGEPVAVYASARVSLNGRPRKEMIAPGVDLAKENRSLFPYQWVLPLEKLPISTAQR